MVKNYLTKFIFLTALFASLSGQAQVNEVLKASQFGGVTNVSFNPAIADNPFLVDINLVGVGFGLQNNYVGINSKALTHPNILMNDPNFQSDQLTERLNGNSKKVYLGMSVQGPLSFMFSFGKKRNNKNALAFSYHLNSSFNIDGVSQQLARDAYYGLGSKADSIQPFDYQNLHNQNLGIKMLVWSDVGITYSRVILDKGAHLLKAGVTGKAIVGWAGAYFSSKNIDYRFRHFDTLDIYNTDINYGHSAAISNQQNIQLSDILNSKSRFSFAADLGVVYEWRPNKEKYQYEYDCQQWYHNDVNKYKLAVGFSVIDIGRVVFAKPGNVSSYTANIQGWVPGKAGIKGVSTFDSVLHSLPNNFTVTGGNSFKMWLPTRFNMYIDYEIYKGLGVNLNGIISQNMTKDNDQVHYPTTITLTPRYDCKWFGAYIPLSYNEYGNFGAGFGLRAGPLFVTSSNIITALADKYTYALNIQVGVKITVPYLQQKVHKKKYNSDFPRQVNDSICPSASVDLYNYYHKNPSSLVYSTPTPGKAGPGSYIVTRPNPKGGCPDSSYVTIASRPGPSAGGNKTASICAGSSFDLTTLYPNTGYAGYEWSTKTPTAVSVGTYKLIVRNAGGCTDSAIATITELARPGISGNKTDSILPGTTYDLASLYPKTGYKTYTWLDLPSDAPVSAVPIGVYHLAVANENGCADTASATIVQKTPPPVVVLTKKEEETVKYAFDNLEFEFAKDVIKTKSHPSLDKLAMLLQEKGYGLKIEGHTDSIGTPERNMNLSIRRAEAVKTYLVGKGVLESRLETAGFGQTRPIATNKTEAGRQKNRRVEMTIIYK